MEVVHEQQDGPLRCQVFEQPRDRLEQPRPLERRIV
jgi:hypothetical protein